GGAGESYALMPVTSRLPSGEKKTGPTAPRRVVLSWPLGTSHRCTADQRPNNTSPRSHADDPSCEYNSEGVILSLILLATLSIAGSSVARVLPSAEKASGATPPRKVAFRCPVWLSQRRTRLALYGCGPNRNRSTPAPVARVLPSGEKTTTLA